MSDMKTYFYMKKKIYGVALAVVLAAGANAQSLSLQQYREKVLHYNQDLKQSQEAVNAAMYSLKSIKTGFFPKLDASGNYSYQIEDIEFMPGVGLKHDNYGVEAGLVQNVYSGSAVRKQYDAAKIQQAIAKLGEEHTVDNIVYAADINYWTVVSNRDMYAISTRFVQIVGELFDVVDKRFEEGAISKTDVLQVQSRLKEAELQLTTSVVNYRTALQAFNILVGSEVNAEVSLSDSIHLHAGIPVKTELDGALDSRADYQIAVQDIELAKQQTRLVKANYLPQVAVGVKENWGTTLINVDGTSRFSTIAFANVNIPVFHWGERRHNVRMSETMETTRELERSKLQDRVSRELNGAWVNLTESLKRIEIVNSSLQIAQNNLLLNTFSYNEGRLPILDVLSAQVTWLQAYTNVVSVNYQYRIALAEYIKAQGGMQG